MDDPYAVILGPTTQTAIHYLALDERGSVLGAYDESSVTMSVAYDDWGSPLQVTGAQIGNLMWKGLHRDEQTGLYYARARWYDPSIGRFMSEDPAGFAGGVNPYTFADDDPVNGSDPSGMFGSGGIFGAINKCGLFCQFTVDLYHNRQPSKIPKVPPLKGMSPGALRYHVLHEKGLEGPGWADPFLLVGGLDEKEGEVAVTAAEKSAEFIGKRFGADQSALVALAKEAIQRGGVDLADVPVLQEWAEELGLSFRGVESHPGRPFGQFPHIHIGPINHIPLLP